MRLKRSDLPKLPTGYSWDIKPVTNDWTMLCVVGTYRHGDIHAGRMVEGEPSVKVWQDHAEWCLRHLDS